jgi:hypothetical protein
MNPPRLTTVLVTIAVLVIGLLFYSLGHAGKSPAQDGEKSLDIARYPNEPLELVDIKVNENSIKAGVKIKSRNNVNKWGRDDVKFREKDDWFKNLKIRLRNISGRPIIGLSVALYFEHPREKMYFSLNLARLETRDFRIDPLQPGEEIELQVKDELFNRRMQSMRQYGVDANVSAVSLSVDTAWFSDDLKWTRGAFSRRDPTNPNKWDAVDKPAAPGASRLRKPAGFILVGFKTLSYAVQSANTCQAAYGGETDPGCDGDYYLCVQVRQLGNGVAGTLSAFPVNGTCEYLDPSAGLTCETDTTHYILEYDPACPAPTPTPTPPPCHPSFTACNLDSDCCPGNHCNWSYGNQCYPNYSNCPDQHYQDACITAGG